MDRMRIDLTRLTETHAFTFDEAFDSHVTNKDVSCYIHDCYGIPISALSFRFI